MPETIGELIVAAAYWVVGESAAAAAASSAVVIGDITVAQIVGTIALNAAAYGLSEATRPSFDLPQQKVNVKAPVGPRSRGYGRTRIGGQIALIKRSEVTGDGILYLAVMLNTGEIDAIEEHWFDDQIVRIDETGTRVSPPGAAVYPARFLDGQRVTIRTHLGASTQTADALLVSAFPGFWTDAHRLDGIAYSVLKLNGVALTDFGEVYSGIPNYTALIRASKVWDPRDDDQDPDDPSTWTWSDNAALVIMDYVRHADGMRMPAALLPVAAIDDLKIQADICDEPVALIGGGTEARYRLSGRYDFTEQPKATLSKMLASCDGWLRLREDGAIALEVGAFTTPTATETFTDADIISYVDFRRGAPKADLKNEIRATYLSPGHNYQQQEADPWRDEDSIAVDGLQSATISLDWCFSHSQARRMMKVMAARLNPEWQGKIVTNARGLNLMGKRYMRLTLADFGLDTTFYIKPGASFDMLSGRCTFDVCSFASSVFDFDPEEEGNSPENLTPGDHGIVVPENATQLVITADGAGGGGDDNGAGGGARSVKTIAIDPADWGQIIQFTVGAHGIGEAVNVVGGVMTDGGDSTVTGTLTAGAIAITAGGGKTGAHGAAGGTATGGDTNTSGGAGSGPDGGDGASGAPPNENYGGGGDLQTDGGDGFVDFAWTF